MALETGDKNIQKSSYFQSYIYASIQVQRQ